MVEGQPADDHRSCGLGKSASDHPLVGEQVAVADGDPFGLGGRARGVLEKSQRVAAHPRILPGSRQGLRVGQLVGRQPVLGSELGQAAKSLGLGKQGRHRQDHGGLRIREDLEQPGERFDRGRGISRDRNHSLVEAAEKRGNELESGRIEQQRAVLRAGMGSQSRGNRPRAAVELVIGPGERWRSRFRRGKARRGAVRQKSIRLLRWRQRRAPAQELDQRVTAPGDVVL